MIKITSTQQAEQLKGILPELVITKMRQFEGDDGAYDPDIFGYLLWLEPSDDIDRLTEFAEVGLLSIFDTDWPGFEFVDLHVEGERHIYEIVIAIDVDKVIVLFVEDTAWLDSRLKNVLNKALSE